MQFLTEKEWVLPLGMGLWAAQRTWCRTPDGSQLNSSKLGLYSLLLFPSHPREKDVLHEKRELEAKPTALAMFMDRETTGNPRAGDRLEPLRGLLVLQPKSH